MKNVLIGVGKILAQCAVAGTVGYATMKLLDDKLEDVVDGGGIVNAVAATVGTGLISTAAGSLASCFICGPLGLL